MIYACCDEKRSAAVLGNPTLNGIDYLEVLDHERRAGSPRQQIAAPALPQGRRRRALDAGERPDHRRREHHRHRRRVDCRGDRPAAAGRARRRSRTSASLPDAANVLVVRTNESGDFSPYTLRLVNDAEQATEDPFEVTEASTGSTRSSPRSTSPSRWNAGPTSTARPPRRTARPAPETPAADQLPRQGLRHLPRPSCSTG